MYQRKFEISLIFMIVCITFGASSRGPDLKWFDRCRDTTQCPYGVGVYHNKSLICDGVVISKHHVLTAASCFNDIESLDEHLISVRVDAIDDNSEKFYDVDNIKIHELYKKTNKTDVNYDITVLKISDKDGFDYDINMVLLPHEELESHKFQAETFGWAHMRWREGWDYLTHHPVNVYPDPQDCNHFGKDVGSNQFCGIMDNKTVDYIHYAIHGSPLIYKKTLIGISSERAKSFSAQLYLNVYNLVTWISRAMY